MSDVSYSKEDIVGYECKHTHYVTAIDKSPNDLLLVKEKIHLKDRRLITNIRLRENFKRPFWITQKAFRNHKDKKDWELKDRLIERHSTQCDLVRNAALALEQPIPANAQLRRLARSPYLYGCDITSGALVKYGYQKRFPDALSNNTVAVSDTETDMVHGHLEIIMQSITFKDRAYLAVVKDFFEGFDLNDVPRLVVDTSMKYIKKYIEQRNIKIEVELFDNPGQVVEAVLKRAHEWKPDFLAFWNMDFDIIKMEQALTKYGFDLGDVWSDPCVPKRYRSYKYKQGQTSKVSASGRAMSLAGYEQWHTVYAPSSFYVIDSMCVYFKLRMAKGKLPSYSLKSVLLRDLKGDKAIEKLNFDEVKHIEDGALWHNVMQKKHKLEYCVYNLVDCISVEMLDETTTDLSMQISAQCGHSEYHKFPSQPRRLCDDLHFETLEHGFVCATTSDQMSDENDKLLVGHDGWIVTLRSDLTHDDGIELVEELPGHRSLFRRDVADLDVRGTYPNEEWLFNISKRTTANELCHIVGIPESLQRATGINLSGGYVNAVETYTTVFKAPTFDQLHAYFRNEDPLPPDFDEHLRIMMASMIPEELLTDEAVDDEDEEEIEL